MSPPSPRMTSSGIEGDVKKSLLDRPDAEKVFQPWWDSVEDYLLNILIALGIQQYSSLALSHIEYIHRQSL